MIFLSDCKYLEIRNYVQESRKWILKVINLSQWTKNQICWSGEEPVINHDKTKILQFTSLLDNSYLWIIRYDFY